MILSIPHGLQAEIWPERPERGLVVWVALGYFTQMSNLAEIKAAADALPPAEKQELMLFLGARLRAQGGATPDPRELAREQMDAWVAEDQSDMGRFRDGR